MARDQAHDPTIRISDADRQVVATALAKNAAEGRLTLEELEERLGTVYAAKTYGDINSLLSDLPRGGASPLVLAGDRLPADREPGRAGAGGGAVGRATPRSTPCAGRYGGSPQ